MLARHGIFTLLDFHQDLYNERFQGEGWPDWAVADDGVPAEPQRASRATTWSTPALNRAFDNFWANVTGRGPAACRSATPPPGATSPGASATRPGCSATTC